MDDAGQLDMHGPEGISDPSSSSPSSWIFPALVTRTAGRTVALNKATGGPLFGAASADNLIDDPPHHDVVG